MKVTLYVLKSRRSGGKRYIGITNDLGRRLSEHRSMATKAGQLLGEFRILHTEQFSDHASARVRERLLKKGQGAIGVQHHFPDRSVAFEPER